jgi:polysaccharide biosynthesis protein PslH
MQQTMRILLITVEGKARGGREQLAALLEVSLRALPGVEVDLFRLPLPVGETPVTQRLRGRIDGITGDIEDALGLRLASQPPECVVIDGSNLGRLARLAKRALGPVPVLTFYHNIEARFFWDAVRASPSVRAVGVVIANAWAERLATRWSDRRIMLNDRDSKLLARHFGRSGTDILPMALPDRYEASATQRPRPLSQPYALFVGGSFYANVEGMMWYAREIAPNAPLTTVVVGRGMEEHRERLEQYGGVKVVGPADDLGPWYAHAHVVVAPILSGSGMKTKTAEALMHGKPIIGTPEAFTGYEIGWTDRLVECETGSDFLDALRIANGREPGFDPELRGHYERFHSPAAMRDRLGRIVDQACVL